jgi:hypothetical protein
VSAQPPVPDPANEQAEQPADQQAEHPGHAPAPTRDLAEVPAVEVIGTTAVHLMSAAAVQLGLAEDLPGHRDLDEARALIDALAGLVAGAAPHLGHHHAAPLRDGLQSLQLAFREASAVADAAGEGPGERFTGPVHPRGASGAAR